MNLCDLHSFLLDHLIEDVMPFWIKHSVDWTNSGMWTCLADDGTVLKRDKYIWSNARALWTFSALVNRIAGQHPDRVNSKIEETWRRAADNQYHFLERCGRDDNGYWIYVVDETGCTVIEGENSIVVDAFAIYGLVEYFRLKCYDWAFAHFPVKEHGEWTQKLDRFGHKIDDLIALPVKDPYHLPRGLIIAIETLDRLTQ